MSEQLTIFGCTLAHREGVGYAPDSDTSKAAAEMVAPFVTENEERVESVIRAAGPQGATASEIMAALGTTNPNNVRPRCTGLRNKGRIADSGLRRKAHENACAETVWVIA